METFFALLAICAGNSPVPGEFPAQRPVTRNFDVFFDLRVKKRLSKQSWGRWFETLSRPLWCHCNDRQLTVPWGTWLWFWMCNFHCITVITFVSISSDIAFRGMVQGHSDDESNLVQVMAWCRQATSHYLSLCWPKSIPPYRWVRTRKT